MLGGGLLVVPAAPALVELSRDPLYRDALLAADVAITDSGLMILLWRLLEGESIPRVSGLAYLKLLLGAQALQAPGATFWVMPSADAREKSLTWLQGRGHSVTRDDFHVAPTYDQGNVADATLLSILKRRSPPHILIGLGGGVQEKLGAYIKSHLDYRPGIHCIGAAIAFLTGDQVRIPDWADRNCLGWLLRCVDNPQRYVPRYWKALGLVPLMMKYRERLPDVVGTMELQTPNSERGGNP
jgi:UDP-N-acetyl-D-mannosaminuronic acid transferase (WecB/TagA/CpsF family)